MATWQELGGFVKNNYKIQSEEVGHISINFNTGGLRTQMLHLFLEEDSLGNEWMTIGSAIGAVGQGDLATVLTLANQKICGGLVIVDDVVVVRHCVPLENADPDEVMLPIGFVANIADELEQIYSGSDNF